MLVDLHNRNELDSKIPDINGGYLNFSHLTELENICITKMYMRKQYKSSLTKNHEIKQKYFF